MDPLHSKAVGYYRYMSVNSMKRCGYAIDNVGLNAKEKNARENARMKA